MGTPKYATSGPGLRRYAHPSLPDEPLLSVTSVLQSLGKPALIGWAAKVTAELAVEQWPVFTARLRTDRDGVLRDLKAARTAAGEKATEHGSLVHDAAEQYVLTGAMPTDPDLATYVQSYVAWLTEWGVDLAKDIHATEITVADRHHGYAGTADLQVYLPLEPGVDGRPAKKSDDGRKYLWLVDFKSSQTKPATTVYADHALQLAAYAFATEAWLPDGQIVKHTRPVGAAVLNLRKASYGLIPIPRLRDAHEAFTHLAAVARWQDTWETPPVITPAGVKAKRTRKTTTAKKSTTTEKAA